jgi:agmatine deiminase
VDKLEDRLPPGSVLDLFAAGEPVAELPANKPAAESRPRAFVRPMQKTPEVSVRTDTAVPAAVWTSRELVRAQDDPNQTKPMGLTGDPLAGQPDFTTNLGDDASSQWLGLSKDSWAYPLRPGRSGRPLVFANGVDQEIVATAPARSIGAGTSGAAAMASEMVNVIAPAAGAIAATTPEDRAPEGLHRGINGQDPNQSLAPYSITYDGRRDAPTTGIVRSPAEYDPMRGVLFNYTTFTSTVTAMVAALTGDPGHDDIAYVVVSSVAQQNSATTAFTNAGADMSKVQFFIQPSNSVWIRDYGPHFVTVDGAPAIVDSHYYGTRPQDNFIPTLLGDNNFKMPTYDMGLYYSGGNFQPGPNNSGFVTSLVNYHNPAGDGFDTSLISELYNKYQGIDTLHILPQLPFSVDSTGHIDMWMYLVDADTVIISEFIPGSNATAIQITNDAVTYMQNLGFEVHRPKAWNSGGTHFTYTNAFRVNDRLFVPVYGTAIVPGGNPSYNDEDADAMAKWQAAAGPGVELIPIQCTAMIPSGGAIHCIVMQVPRYTGSAPAVNVVSPTAGAVWVKGTTQTIEWSAIDTNNTEPVSLDIYYSPIGGPGGRKIASDIPDTGSFTWVPFGRESSNAVFRVVAKSGDGDQTVAYSQPFTIRTGTQNVYDFSTGAGIDKTGFGSQTSSWSAISGNPGPVGNPLSAGNYSSLSTSNNSRYIAPVPSPISNESTHTFNFNLSEPISSMDEIEVRWEGYADHCTNVELYVWDLVAGQWGDGTGLSGNNRYMDSWAGNADGNLIGYIRSDYSRYVDGIGTIRFLVYSDRRGAAPDSQHFPNDAPETFHDYMSVAVKQV